MTCSPGELADGVQRDERRIGDRLVEAAEQRGHAVGDVRLRQHDLAVLAAEHAGDAPRAVRLVDLADVVADRERPERLLVRARAA